MNQENITVKVNLDTRGFEQALQGLISTTEKGTLSMADAIGRAADMTTIITGIGGVKTAFNTAITAMMTVSGPVVLAIAGIGAAVAAVTLAMSDFNETTREGAEILSNLTKQLQANREGHSQSTQVYANTILGIQTQAEAARDLSKVIEDLSGQEQYSATSKALLLEKINMMNDVIPGLALTWDEYTNSLSMTSEELKKNIEIHEAQLKLESDKERLNQLMVERVKIWSDMESANEKLTESKKYLSLSDEELLIGMDDLDEAHRGRIAQLSEQGYAHGRLRMEYDKHSAALEENERAQRELWEAIAENSITVTEHAQAVEAAEERIQLAAEQRARALTVKARLWEQELGEIETALQSLADLQEEHARAEAALAADTEELLRRMQRAYDSYVNYANNAFSRLGDPLNISLEEMIDNLQFNQEAMRNWSDGIATLANATEHQIDAGFLEQLRNMGPASAIIVDQLVQDMETGGYKIQEINGLLVQGVDDANTQINKGFDFSGFIGHVDQTWRDLAQSIEDNTSLVEALEQQKAEAQKVILSMMDEQLLDTLNRAADNIGVQIPAGIAQGIENNDFEAVNKVVELMRNVIAAAQREAQIQSPSKVMEKLIGQNIALGVAAGIDANADEAAKAAEKLAEETIQSAKKAVANMQMREEAAALLRYVLKSVNEPSVRIGQSIVDGITNGFTAKSPKIRGTIDEEISLMLHTMEQIGHTNANTVGESIVNGITAGFNAMLPSLIASVTAGMAMVHAATQGFLGISSPSRLFRDSIGRNIARGIGAGIDDEMPGVADRLEEQIKLCLAAANRAVYIDLTPADSISRQAAAMDSAMASSARTNALLERIAVIGERQVTPNVNVTLEPEGDLRGFFEYISTNIKRVDYLSGSDI